jgi:hypothetical protein
MINLYTNAIALEILLNIYTILNIEHTIQNIYHRIHKHHIYHRIHKLNYLYTNLLLKFVYIAKITNFITNRIS